MEPTVGEEGNFEDSFGAREYIHTYYPEISDFSALLKIIELMYKNEEGNYEIATLAKKTGTPHEIIENAAIFDFYRIVTEHLIEEFPSGNASILDIGGGPTIYQHIALSLVANRIIHSEFLEKNRDEVVLWLNAHKDAYNWDSYFKFLQCLFSLGEMHKILHHLQKNKDTEISLNAQFILETLQASNVEDFKRHVRAKIGENVIFGDMHKLDLGAETLDEEFNIVTSNFVAESASTTKEEWERSMYHMIRRVKINGYFIQTAIQNATWYQVGEKRIPAVPVNQDDISRVCEKEGCRIIYQKLLTGSNKELVGYDGMVFTLAQKVKQ